MLWFARYVIGDEPLGAGRARNRVSNYRSHFSRIPGHRVFPTLRPQGLLDRTGSTGRCRSLHPPTP